MPTLLLLETRRLATVLLVVYGGACAATSQEFSAPLQTGDEAMEGGAELPPDRQDKPEQYRALPPASMETSIVDSGAADTRPCDPTDQGVRYGTPKNDCTLTDDPSVGGQVLSSCDLHGEDLSGMYLEAADLTAADLSCTALGGAFLGRASLRDTNLRGADLTGANLIQATAVGADFSNANLTGTNLLYTIMERTILTGVIWSDTTCPDDTLSNDNGNTCQGHLDF